MTDRLSDVNWNISQLSNYTIDGLSKLEDRLAASEI